MPLIAQGGDSGPAREPIPADLYAAVFCMVVDMGTQETNYGPKRQVRIVWQIPELRQTGTDQDGKEYDRPRFIAKNYTNSLHEKCTLTKHLNAARGKPFTKAELDGFDLFSVLGAPCFLQVAQGEGDRGKYAYIEAVTKFKGGDAPKLEGDPVKFSLDDWDGKDQPEDIPAWLWEKISASKEFAEKCGLSPEAQAVASAFKGEVIEDDQIPF